MVGKKGSASKMSTSPVSGTHKMSAAPTTAATPRNRYKMRSLSVSSPSRMPAATGTKRLCSALSTDSDDLRTPIKSTNSQRKMPLSSSISPSGSRQVAHRKPPSTEAAAKAA